MQTKEAQLRRKQNFAQKRSIGVPPLSRGNNSGWFCESAEWRMCPRSGFLCHRSFFFLCPRSGFWGLGPPVSVPSFRLLYPLFRIWGSRNIHQTTLLATTLLLTPDTRAQWKKSTKVPTKSCLPKNNPPCQKILLTISSSQSDFESEYAS